ncbi:MAG TPA: pitrilysin family protein [Candidatus Acidoferrum sp.]|nr:pitrilysin family protein [Candidatus Acidoferrum sp.]
MNRITTKLFTFLFALVFVASVATGQQSSNSTPQPASQAPTSAPSSQGTGIVPSGVKLVPEMPPASSPRPFQFPAAAEKTLANGLRVFVVTDRRNPAVAARLVILSAGTIQDPPGAPGVAQMTASLLTQGAEKRSAGQIAEAIDFVGGTLNAAADKDATTVTLDIVRKDLDTGLDLMSDVVLHPAFQPDEIERQRQQMLSNLAVEYADPDYLSTVVLARAIYGDSPYGFPADGTPETLRKMQRDDFVKFHDAGYAPNESLLAFSGDITSDEAFALAEKYFGSWPRHNEPSAAPKEPPAINGLHIWLIDKPDADQTQIRAGKIGIRRDDPDFIPLTVTNRIFGGGYNSRLNTEIRVRKGLTYGAYSSFMAHRYTGSFSVGTFTRTPETVEATRLVIELISKMAQGNVTPAELGFATDYLAGVYPIESETSEQVADRVLTVAAFGLPSDYNSTYPDQIHAVTVPQVDAMCQKYLSAQELDLVLVGNVSAFRDTLKQAFPHAEFQEIPLTDLDVLAPDLRAVRTASPQATPESLAQGRQILLAAAQAAGGAALASVKTLSMTEDGTMARGGAGAPIHIDWTVAYPNRSIGKVSLSSQKITQICDGKSAWLEFPQQTVEVTKVLGEFERGIALFGGGWGLYQQVLDGKIQGQFIGEETIDGNKTQGVSVEASFGTLRLFFDSASHLLFAARYQSTGPNGVANNEQRWSDYRPLAGGKFAYSTAIYRHGDQVLKSAVSDVKINPTVDSSAFTVSSPPAPATAP